MKAFFKDKDKLIINSMDYTEALVGKAFLEGTTTKTIKVEQRYDVNDDFDGLVITLVDSSDSTPSEDTTPSEETTEPTVAEATAYLDDENSSISQAVEEIIGGDF